MRVMYERVAGLDVHKKTVVACRMRVTADNRVEWETKTFGTMSGDLLSLHDWLSRTVPAGTTPMMKIVGARPCACPAWGDRKGRLYINRSIFKGGFTNLWHATDNENLECQSAL